MNLSQNLNKITIMRAKAFFLTFLLAASISAVGAESHFNTQMKGDIDGDGTLSVNDVALLVEIVLQNKEVSPSSDMNGDGEANITDVTLLVNAILEPNNNGPHTQDEDANPNLPVLAPKGK